jgi:hypothetical protein
MASSPSVSTMSKGTSRTDSQTCCAQPAGHGQTDHSSFAKPSFACTRTLSIKHLTKSFEILLTGRHGGYAGRTESLVANHAPVSQFAPTTLRGDQGSGNAVRGRGDTCPGWFLPQGVDTEVRMGCG